MDQIGCQILVMPLLTACNSCLQARSTHSRSSMGVQAPDRKAEWACAAHRHSLVIGPTEDAALLLRARRRRRRQPATVEHGVITLLALLEAHGCGKDVRAALGL